MGHSDTGTGVGDRTRRATTDATIVVDEDLLPLVETFEPSVVVDRKGLLPTKRVRAKTIK